MDISTIIILLVIFAAVGVIAFWYYKSHTMVCPDEECKATVWVRYSDCSPCGPNPLGVVATMESFHCKKCGLVKKEVSH